ncbi:MAG TPA: VOC family protein [Thermodesulfobacteriota bacterium]|nr:VOC family protein [Thermodesulfobacteriota bacterium]
MVAKLKHVAIVSERYAELGRFYEAVFGMKGSPSPRPERAVVVGDGYVGLNINPRKAGRQAGLDHFGFEVEDVETVLARIRERYPSVNVLKRPSTRPFAGLSAHDPAGNVFDISQAGMENRREIYVEGEWEQPRRVSHLAIRTLAPEAVARFYVDVFGLRVLESPAADGGIHLSDGRVALVILPWRITDYEGTGIERPGPDHLGFRVESVEAVRERLDALAGINPFLAPKPVGAGKEGSARLRLFARCPYGRHHFADPDGVLLDIAE